MRIQIDVSAPKAEQLRKLMAVAEFKNWAELFNNSVTLCQWTIREVQSGHVIAAFDERRNKLKELAMPFLQHIAEQSRDDDSEDGPDANVDPEELLLNQARAQIARQQEQIDELKRQLEHPVAAAVLRAGGAGGGL